MIGDQLTSLKAPCFTILIAPNPTDQPARLEKLSCFAVTKFHSDGITLLFSQKRPATLRHSNLDELGDLKERTLASAKYTEKDLQTITKFCIDLFFQDEASCRPMRRPLSSARIMSIPPAALIPTVSHLQLRPSVVGSAFVGTSSSIGRTRQSKILYLGLSSSFLFERVWMTQGLPCIPPGVTLNKTPNTSSGRKFKIGHLTSSPIYPYYVWYWWGPRRVQPHLILSRKTQALAQMK